MRSWTWICLMRDGTALVYRNMDVPAEEVIFEEDGTRARFNRTSFDGKSVAYFREQAAS